MSALVAATGDRDLVAHMVDAFLLEIPARLRQIHEALDSGQWPDAVRRNAHHLRGSSLALGAEELAQACASLERIAQDGARSQVVAMLPALGIIAGRSLAILTQARTTNAW